MDGQTTVTYRKVLVGLTQYIKNVGGLDAFQASSILAYIFTDKTKEEHMESLLMYEQERVSKLAATLTTDKKQRRVDK